MTMTFNDFMSKMLKPTYVWRMAAGIAHPWMPQDESDQRPLVRSARTRLRNAQRQIDDLVLQRAQVIADERRCAALREIGTAAPEQLGEPETVLHVRCEFQKDHGPVGPGIADSRISHVTARRDWDHGAPSAKVWWMAE